MCNLVGIRIVVTRATHQAEELASPLRELGADVILAPVIGIAAPADPAPLREAAAQCDEYDWIIFTSANAVTAFAAELPQPRPSCAARVAAIGASTRKAAEDSGFAVAVVPAEYVAESLVEALGTQHLMGARILIPSAAVTRDVAPQALRKLGARVETVEAYRNVIPSGSKERIAEVFTEPYPDWVTFASSSAAENTLKLSGREALQRVKVATIGPITSGTVRKLGLTVAAEARVHNAAGLVEAICAS
ncbi:MAG: uroporphyrinogen-III synthase [Acidobacteriaceae bacterium]|nr:uroporphyrinogen-III synthase [Acidobacteriaceae bacterium]